MKTSQEIPFQMFQKDIKLTPSVEKTKKNNPIPKDLTSTLIDSNINQMSWPNQMKSTSASLSQSKSMGFENKQIPFSGKSLGFENHSATPHTKPMTLQSSANNWNDLWVQSEETPQIKQLSLSDINDLLS